MIMVVDCLDPFPAEVTDPFLLLHAFGPAEIRDMPPLGMHPHRGFNEVPYLKQGRWLATDPWNMSGEVREERTPAWCSVVCRVRPSAHHMT